MGSPVVERRWVARSITSRDLGLAGIDRAVLLERGLGRRGDDARQRRLARAGRAVQHHRVQATLLDRRAQGASPGRAGAPDRRARRASPDASARPAGPRPAARAVRPRALSPGSNNRSMSAQSVSRSAWTRSPMSSGASSSPSPADWSASCSETCGCPPRVLVASSPGAAAGANIGISAVSAATASIAHIRAGRINWRLFGWMAPPSILGALVGGYVSGLLPGDVLLFVIAAVLLYSGLDLLRWTPPDRRERPGEDRPTSTSARRSSPARSSACSGGSSASSSALCACPRCCAWCTRRPSARWARTSPSASASESRG